MRVALRIAIEHAIRLLSLLQAGVYVSCGQDRAIACGCYSYAVAASMHVRQLSDTRPSCTSASRTYRARFCIPHSYISCCSAFYWNCRSHGYPACYLRVEHGRNRNCYQ